MGHEYCFLGTQAQVSLGIWNCVGKAAVHLWAALGCWVPAKAVPRFSVSPGAAIAFLEERAHQLGLSCQKVEVSLGP